MTEGKGRWGEGWGRREITRKEQREWCGYEKGGRRSRTSMGWRGMKMINLSNLHKSQSAGHSG